LGALGGLLAAVAAAQAVNLIVDADSLRVRKVIVRGNVRLSSGEVIALLGPVRGGSILTADLAASRLRLKASPWVADVGLRRVLPSTLEVLISERVPLGICRIGAELYLIDAHGTVIDEHGPQYADLDLPIIDGLVPAPRDDAPAIDQARVALTVRLLASLAPRKALASRVSQIDVRDPHDATVILDGDPALLHLGEERFLQRLQTYVELAPALRARVRAIDYVDLRFDERIYVGGSS
jgi:cell division protein FtsQ